MSGIHLSGREVLLSLAAGTCIVEPSIAVFADENFRVFHIAPEDARRPTWASRKSLTRGKRGRTVKMDTAVQYTAE